MKRMPVRALGDLLAAAESVGDDQPVGRGMADGGKEFQFTDRDGNIVLIGFKAEGTRHAAAAGSWSVELDPDPAQNGFFCGHLHQGFVMAVTVQERFAVEPWQRETLGVGFEEFAEQKSLARQSLRTFVARKEVEEFIAKDGDTARLQADHWNARLDLRREFVENPEQEGLGTIEHAVIVERAPTAQVRPWHHHPEASRFENLDRRLGGARLKIIVERVRPEEYGRSLRIMRCGIPRGIAPAAMEPGLESLWGKSRDLSISCYSGDELRCVAQERKLRRQIR